jgi:FkbM family methyltransferase
MQLFLKHLLIGTPLEKPLTQLRPILEFRFRITHPELQELYEEPKRIDETVRAIVQPGFNCIDVGGHLGSMLNLFLKQSPDGAHHVFEPVPKKAEWLKRKFTKARVHAMALGDESGMITFFENLSRPGYSSMQPPADSRDRFQEVIIPCEPLDKVLHEDHRVHFIKLDVEGAELKVLRGAEKTMMRHKPHLLFECTTCGATEFGGAPVDVFDLLTGKYQYNVFLLKSFLGNGAPLDREQFQNAVVYPFQAINFIAAPKATAR